MSMNEMRERSLSLEDLSTKLEISQAEADQAVKAGQATGADAS